MNKTFLSAAFAFAIAALSSTPLYAASSSALIERLTSAKLSALLKSSAATQIETTKPSDGVEVVSFNDGHGTVDFVLSDCTADGCGMMQMTIFFDREESKKISLATINSFNAKVLNAQAAQLPAGDLVLVDIFVTSGGVTEDNIMANVSIFLQAPVLLAEHLGSAGIVSNSEPAKVMPASAPQTAGIQAGIATQSPRLKNLNVLEILSSRTARAARKPR